jgi:general secretion pathway protein H
VAAVAKRAPGFTLVEILVVVAIAAIVAALIAASLEDDGRRATEREATRLAGALEHAAALAQWRRSGVGVSAESGRWRFWTRDGADRWVPLGDDDALAVHTLPAGMSVAALRYAGAPVAPDAVLPLRPSGRNEPYQMVVASPAARFVVTSDPLNRVGVARDR